ncbi:MAG: methyltransferase domain-containing protein [Bradymonadales bacterium]|nr:MAG: methyltransferase domain-containing protein [Bradymonadales bacterium]
MKLVSPEIEAYCLSKTSSESEVRRELAEFTRANVSQSQMLIGQIEASFLQLLIRLGGFTRALEIGCFTGYSALAMAEALPDGGQVLTLDINEETTQIAKKFWAKSPHGKKVEARVGPALESLAQLKPSFDLVFVDADKQSVLAYVERALELLSNRGCIVVDNVLWSGQVLSPEPEDQSSLALRGLADWAVRQPSLRTALYPIRDGILVIRKDLY